MVNGPVTHAPHAVRKRRHLRPVLHLVRHVASGMKLIPYERIHLIHKASLRIRLEDTGQLLFRPAGKQGDHAGGRAIAEYALTIQHAEFHLVEYVVGGAWQAFEPRDTRY